MTHCLQYVDGGRWVAIAGLVVARFADGGDAATVRVDAFFDAPVLGGDVAAMYLDDRGGAWIAAADGQLNHIAAGERTARTLCETAAPAFAFTADAASVYCATPGEVVRVGKQNG